MEQETGEGRFRVRKCLLVWLCCRPNRSSMPVFAARTDGRVGRAVARRRASLAADLRAVEELASLSQLASGEVGAYLHRPSALRATPRGRVSDRVLASFRRFRRNGE